MGGVGFVCPVHQEWVPEGLCRWCEPLEAEVSESPLVQLIRNGTANLFHWQAPVTTTTPSYGGYISLAPDKDTK